MLTYFCVWLVAGRSSVKKSYFYFSLPLFDFKEVTNTNCRLLGCSHCFCVTSFRNSGSGPPCESLNTHNAKLGMKLNLSRFLFKFSAIFKQKKSWLLGVIDMKRMAKISIFPHVLFRNKIEIGADLHAWSPRGDCKSSVAENPVDRAKVKKETALLNTKIAGISAFCFLFILNELSKKPQHKTTTLNSPSPPLRCAAAL